MPIVPEQQVRVRPVSPGYQTGAGASADAFGAGIAQSQRQFGAAIADTGNAVSKIATQLEAEKIDRDTTEADLAYAQRSHELLYGNGQDKQGFYSLKGKAALDAAPQTAEELRKIRREVIEQYSHPAVRRKLELLIGKRELAHSSSIAEFNLREKRDYDNSLSEARIAQANVDAVAGSSNPQTVADNLVRARGAVHDMADRNGWSAEVRDRKLKETQTAIYAEVIRGAIQRQDANEVKRLMDLYAKPELMDQPVIDQLKEQRNQVVLAAESQAAFDQYMAMQLPEEETIALIRDELKDKPELRDEVERRANNEFSRKVREEKRFADDAKANAFEQIASGVPAHVAISNLSEEERDAVYSDANFLTNAYRVEEAVAEGRQYATSSDNKTATKYRELSRKELAEVHISDLLNDQRNLTREEYDEILRRREGARKFLEEGNDATARAIQRSDNELRRLFASDPRIKYGGRTQTAKQRGRQNALRQEVDAFINEHFDTHGRPPDDAVISKYISRLAVNMDNEPWLWWNTEHLPGEGLPVSEVESRYEDFTPEQKEALLVDPNTVSEEGVEYAKSILEQNNLPVTQRRLERMLGMLVLEEMGEPNTDLMLNDFLRQEGRPAGRVPFERAVQPQTFDDVLRTYSGEVPVSLRDQLARHEGRRNQVYLDSVGIPTVGIGFNLNRGDARERLEQVGADYDAVKAGTAVLTDRQIDELFEMDVADATEDARALFSNFDELSERRQHALIDLSFNLGRTSLSKFYRTRRAIEAGQFDKAADNLIQSKWYKQVKSRGPTIVAMIREG